MATSRLAKALRNSTSGIRGADDDDRIALSQHLGPMVETKVLTDFRHQPAHVLPYPRRDRTGHVAFIREIQLSLDHRARMDDPGPPTAVERALQSPGARNGKAPLSLRLCGDEIGERFGLDQIHLPSETRAA